MLTPKFEADQDEFFVFLKIRTPYIKISEAEFDIDGNEFKFHCHPFFLWLKFSGEITENGKEKAEYDIETDSRVRGIVETLSIEVGTVNANMFYLFENPTK